MCYIITTAKQEATKKGGENMTVKRVKAAAARRGIYFNGLKQWQNNVVGFGYFAFSPSGRGLITADTLSGFYRLVLQYPVVKEN